MLNNARFNSLAGNVRRILPFVLALLASLTLNVLLAVALKKSNERVESLQRVVSNLRSELRLQPGTVVPALDGRTPSGDLVSIQYPLTGTPVVLYAMSASCQWSLRNSANIREVVRSTEGRYRFYGLTLDDIDQIIPEVGSYPFAVVGGLSNEAIRAYYLGGTPRTIVVEPGGRVAKVWYGAYAGPLGDEVAAFFRVRLPGLEDPNSLPAK